MDPIRVSFSHEYVERLRVVLMFVRRDLGVKRWWQRRPGDAANRRQLREVEVVLLQEAYACRAEPEVEVPVYPWARPLLREALAEVGLTSEAEKLGSDVTLRS